MAVQVVCYEICRQLDTSAVGLSGNHTDQWDRTPATSAQLEGLIEHFEQALIEAEFLNPDNPGQTMTRLRRLLTRVTPDETEVQMLRGILRQLGRSSDVPDRGASDGGG
jgi:tRNA (cytidine32/uridine32-2'-O)-methyltransferase